MQNLGDRIKKLRRSRHLTQQQLAYHLGIDQGAVSRWEKGHILPSARYRKKLEEVLEAPLEEVNLPLLTSVKLDLNFSVLVDENLEVLAASEVAAAVSGCRTTDDLVGTSYLPLLDQSWQDLHKWLIASGAFNQEVKWIKITMPTPTLFSGYRWMESMWAPFRLDSGKLIFRISSRLLDQEPANNAGKAQIELGNKQCELVIPIPAQIENTNDFEQAI